jgi:hypothetical protein
MIFRKMLRASRLDSEFYAGIAGDSTATNEALLVVILTSFAATFGFVGFGQPSNVLIGGIVRIVPLGLAIWTIWSVSAYFVGTRLFGASGNIRSTMRCTGFAFSPGVLLIFAALPVLGVALFFASLGLMLAAGVLAIRNALNLRTAQAAGVNIMCGVFVMGILRLLLTVLGPSG